LGKISPFGIDGAAQNPELTHTVNAIVIGALMAYFMEVAEYLVVTNTSSLTLSVAGIFKVMLRL